MSKEIIRSRYHLTLPPWIAPLEHPLNDNGEGFDITISGSHVVFKFKQPKPFQQATLLAETYLKRWAVYLGLHLEKPDPIQYEFESACTATNIIRPGTASLPVTLQVNNPRRVDQWLPPKTFKLNDSVAVLWNRYRNYLRDREGLAPMAYYCLTWLENECCSRKNAAQHYAISKKVLDELGYLVSEVGTDAEARKAKGKERRPYSEEEVRWVRQVVKEIIMQAAQRDETHELRQIRLDDLPKLS